MPSNEWYYVQDRQKAGPVSREEIRSLFEDGTISDADLVWTQGMSEWKPAGQVQARFAAPAPAPARAPEPAAMPAPAQDAPAPGDPADGGIDLEEPMMEAEVVAAYDVGEGLGVDRNYAPTNEHEYASFGARLGAFLIDGMIVFALNVLVMGLFFGATLFVGSLMAGTSVGDSLLMLLIVGMYGAMVAVPWLYYARQESSMKMATIGKRVTGIYVLDTDGYPVSFMRATGRYFSKAIISGMFCGVGYFFPLFTAKKQALHDLIAATVVVKGKV